MLYEPKKDTQSLVLNQIYAANNRHFDFTSANSSVIDSNDANESEVSINDGQEPSAWRHYNCKTCTITCV